MYKLTSNYIITFSVTLMLFFSTSSYSAAAVDMFLKLPNIQGESVDVIHLNEIDVFAWTWGVSQPGNAVIGAGKPLIQNIGFTKYVDASTPLLITASVTGKRIPSAVLTVRKSGNTTLEYLKITFTNLLITSISLGGIGSQGRLTENVAFSFEQYRVEYTAQNPDGSVGGVYPSSYNIATGAILDAVLKAALAGSGEGSINSISQGVSYSCTSAACPPQGFAYNTSLTLSATPSLLSLFTGWSGACTIINENCQVTLNADKDISATFTLADKARIGNPPGYNSFAAAYDAASGEPTTIMLLEDILPISAPINKVLVLSGGYNTDFSRSANGLTTLQGILSIQGNGKVTADRILVK